MKLRISNANETSSDVIKTFFQDQDQDLGGP